MRIDQSLDFTQDNYQPLSPYKCFTHVDRMRQFIDEPFGIAPVTAHLVPTLYCNQRCYFCTYGQYKEKGRMTGLQMTRTEVLRCIDQLAEVGVKGIIFTGGGEPTLFPGLVEAMAYARQKGLDVALNTNGYRLDGALLAGILSCHPTYIRVSFNAGKALTQKLVTGRDNFDEVLKNIEQFAEMKAQHSPQTDLSIGYVVNIVNLHEMMDFLDQMIQVEARVAAKTGVEKPIYSLQFRPVSNFEHSKHIADSRRIDALLSHVDDLYGGAYRNELADFIRNGDQPSPKTMGCALKIIENDLIPVLRKNHPSNMKIVYPRQKFSDLIAGRDKPYDRCLSCPWYLFIWPDGSVYHCVEWAGNPEFAIGNIFTAGLQEILSGGRRKDVLEKINETTIKTRCVKICAHHEMNILLNELSAPGKLSSAMIRKIHEKDIAIKHENFL